MKQLSIIASTFLIMACNQKTFTLDEVKGTYMEVETEHSEWNKECSLIVTDTTVTLENCNILKGFTGKEIRIIENRLLYLMRFSIHDPDQEIVRQKDSIYEYFTSFEISEKDGIIHLYQTVEDNESITFRKIK